MIRRMLAMLGVAGLMLGGTVGTSVATDVQHGDKEKVTICHATGSHKKPYKKITVSKKSLAAHAKHKHDLIPAPVAGCPKAPATPPPVPEPEPFVPCVVGPGVTQTATTVTGTSANDTIDCTNASPGKGIVGGDGNDTITGTAFNDTIDGGNGNDTITGGPGNDRIEGGNGNDTLTGSAGDDIVTDVGDGEDTITQ